MKQPELTTRQKQSLRKLQEYLWKNYRIDSDIFWPVYIEAVQAIPMWANHYPVKPRFLKDFAEELFDFAALKNLLPKRWYQLL